MITSCPRATASVPIVSGATIACPPGLSVIERTSMRGSADSSRASSSTPRPPPAPSRPRLVTSSAATTKAPGRPSCSRNVAIAALPWGSDCCLGAPALRVRRPRHLRVRAGADDGADLRLHVPLHHRLRRAAALLAPGEDDLVPELDVVVDVAEREVRALVVAVAGEGRDADHVVADHEAVVRPRRVVRQRDVDVLRVVALLEERPDRASDVLAVPGECHLPPRRLAHRLERIAAGEVVVVLDERAVTEVPRSRVVVLDVVRVEAAAERAGRFVPVAGQPLAVGLHLLAGEDGGERAGDPSRLERVRCVDAGADLAEPELLAGLDDRALDLVSLLPRPEQLEPGRARHAVVERAHLAAGDRQPAHVEELDLGQRPAGRLLQHLQRGRSLHLIAVEPAAAGRVDGGSLVALAPDVVAARL